MLRLRGGAKKRKKKTYNTPKKIKHKRKKVKMAILKYYKVESDGKIKRLRRECPTPTCGAGVFVRLIPSIISCILYAYDVCVDGVPPGPPVLRQVRFDVHVPAGHQAPGHVNSYYM